MTRPTREEFERMAWQCTYEEYCACYCPDCKEENCPHREAYRRVPLIDGGLALCPHLSKAAASRETKDKE